MVGTITISKQEYFELRMEQERLSRLECGGVDNWEGYSESLRPEGEPTMKEFASALLAEIEAK